MSFDMMMRICFGGCLVVVAIMALFIGVSILMGKL